MGSGFERKGKMERKERAQPPERACGPYRLFSRGRGIWHSPEGPYAYFEAELLDLRVNET